MSEARSDSSVKQALREILRLKAELARERARRSEPIAIIGMGVRLPGDVDSPDSYWDLLAVGRDVIGPIPADRWDHAARWDASSSKPGSYYVREGGFLSAVDQFDPEFFGIAPLEAATLDPQQRLLLEVAWEALEHAGVPAQSLRGTRTGVFIGIGAADYQRLVLSAPAPDTYAATGTCFSVAAGRLAYVLGLNGPAVAIDTACSSSLVAVHMACRSLRSGESELALAGGVSLMLSPELTVSFCHAGMLSRSGRCRAFAASADGYVRSEGCGLVVLKSLSHALRDGDRIHAVIRGTALSQDGRSSGLTAPSGPAQEQLLRDALRDAGLAPAELDYVEAHGTGTSLGDPIEAQALGAVLGESRPPGQPLLIGSVKTNLGHLEAAAGIAGLLKAVLAVEHGEIPASLHFDRPNPLIAWDALPLAVPTRLTPWPVTSRPRRAGVSSFGFSGTNAHVIVEAAPPSAPAVRAERSAELLLLSAPQPEALRALAQRYASWLQRSDVPLADAACTTAAGRSHFSERLALVCADTAEAARELAAWQRGEAASPVRGRGTAEDAGTVAFAFPAGGRVDAQAAVRLAGSARVFRQSLARCDELLRSRHGLPLLELLEQWSTDPAAAHQVEAEHAARFAITWSLGQLWLALGMKPALLAGTGAGEYAVAQLRGALPLETALELVLAQVRSAADVAATNALSDEVRADALQAMLRTARQQGIGTVLTLTASTESLPVVAESGVAVLAGGLGAGGLGAGDPWRALLHTLARLWVRGHAVQSRGLLGAAEPRRVALPTYPFQRRRFWYRDAAAATMPGGRNEDAPAGTLQAQGGAGDAVAWAAATAAAAERAQLAPVGMDVASYGEKWAALNELTAVLGRNILAELGVFRTAGEHATVTEVLERTGIRANYRHIVRRWLEMLAHEDELERTDVGYRALGTLQPRNAAAAWARCEGALADDAPLWNYVRHAARLAPAVLCGRTSALETLFPGGSFELAAALYRDSLLLRYVNGVAAAALRAYVQALPGNARLRLLEVGAGTGGTTAHLLGAVPQERAEYLYSDVSDAFLEWGRTQFGAASCLRTLRFDLEQDPARQGLEAGSMDVVVAANVVHAARRLRDALERLHSLLRPGGLLLLVESTGHHPWHDLTTGLIEGWQHFDDELRTDTPLLTPDVWLEVLRDAGFSAATALPESNSIALLLKQHVLLARAAGAPRDAVVIPEPAAPAAAAHTIRPTTSNVAAVAVKPAAAEETAVEREERMIAVVRECLMSVLRSDPSRPPARDARMMDLGLDSLMAVRLRNQIQQRLGLEEALPATLAFDYPTIRHVARFIIERTTGNNEEHPPAARAGARSGREPEGFAIAAAAMPAGRDIAALTDAEVELLLRQRLQAEERP